MTADRSSTSTSITDHKSRTEETVERDFSELSEALEKQKAKDSLTQREQIQLLLKQSPWGLTTDHLRSLTGIGQNRLNNLLSEMAKDLDIVRVRRSKYGAPQHFPDQHLASRIEKLRKDLSLSKEEAAARVGVEPATWSVWASGEHTIGKDFDEIERLLTDPNGSKNSDPIYTIENGKMRDTGQAMPEALSHKNRQVAWVRLPGAKRTLSAVEIGSDPIEDGTYLIQMESGIAVRKIYLSGGGMATVTRPNGEPLAGSAGLQAADELDVIGRVLC